MSCHCCTPKESRDSQPRSRTSIIGMILQVIVVYVAMVFGAGTLIHTGHPVAVEVGRLIHVVTLVDPAIGWADAHGYGALGSGLRTISGGVDMSEIA